MKKRSKEYSTKGDLPIRPGDDDDPVAFEEVRYDKKYTMVGKKRPPHRLRPRIDDPGVLDRVCEEIIFGRGLLEICDDKKYEFPCVREIYRAMAKDPDGDVATRITRARERQQDAIIDLIRQLNDQITEANYNSMMTRIKNLQWQAGKLAPKKYGRDAEDPTNLIDNRRQVIINVTPNEYASVVDRLTRDV